MVRISFFVLCLLFLLAGLYSTARGEDQIRLNHFRKLKAGNHTSGFLEATLVTSKRTRVQIMVTKRNEILENYRSFNKNLILS